MVRRRINNRPGNPNYRNKGGIGNHTYAEDQATIQIGGRVVKDSTIAKWDRGTAAIEREMAKVRAHMHTFKPMGRLDSCEGCGMPKVFANHRE